MNCQSLTERKIGTAPDSTTHLDRAWTILSEFETPNLTVQFAAEIRPGPQDVVTARGGDLHRAPRLLLALDLAEVHVQLGGVGGFWPHAPRRQHRLARQ